MWFNRKVIFRMNNRREVNTAEATKTAKEHGMIYIETSAKTGQNVTEVI